MGVNSLPKTVTQQRRSCNLNLGPSESSTITTRLPSHPCKYHIIIAGSLATHSGRAVLRSLNTSRDAVRNIKETRKQDQNNAHKAVNGMAEITQATSKSVPGGKTLIKYTHTHTHPFNSPLSRTTQVSRYQKGKTNLDFTEATDSEWQWHQLGRMQV